MTPDLTGARITYDPTAMIPQRARAERAYERLECSQRGECWFCGERHGAHEIGCRNAPDDECEAAE